MTTDIEYPQSEEIDPEQARFLFEDHCAILIVEGMPLVSEFGIDMMAYRIGDKFKGVKLIPPGVHFVYASASDRNSHQTGPRCGFFHDFKTKELLVKRWSALDEDFDDSFNPTDELIERYRMNLRDLDAYLGPYNFSTYKTYLNLVTRLTPELVETLMPPCNRIRSVPYLTREEVQNDDKNTARTNRHASNPTVDTLLPDLKPDPTTRIRFTKIPDNHTDSKKPISHNMITEYNLDTTIKLNTTFIDQTGRHRLLAELQFSFVTFLLCHVYDCFEQWKKILGLVTQANSGLQSFPDFFDEFVQIFRHQVDQIPVDLFEDIVDSNNLVRNYLDTFFQNIEDCPGDIVDLESKALELRMHLEEKFGWRFHLENDDEQPVIVDLS